MANLKNITELPVAESAADVNLIVNDGGTAKQIPAGQVGAQADWNETDETSPAFIMNKPSVGGGGCVTYYPGGDGYFYEYDFENDRQGERKIPFSEFKEKFFSGIVRLKEGEKYAGTVVGYYLSTQSDIISVGNLHLNSAYRRGEDY